VKEKHEISLKNLAKVHHRTKVLDSKKYAQAIKFNESLV